MKKETRHWGDLRARLELAITSIIELYKEKLSPIDPTSDYESQESTSTNADNCIQAATIYPIVYNYFAYEQMAHLVRKELATSLRDLLHHGLSGAEEYGLNEYSGDDKAVSRYSRSNGYISQVAGVPLSRSLLSLMGLGCFGVSNAAASMANNPRRPLSRAITAGGGLKGKPKHAWELVLYYYELKVGFLRGF